MQTEKRRFTLRETPATAERRTPQDDPQSRPVIRNGTILHIISLQVLHSHYSGPVAVYQPQITSINLKCCTTKLKPVPNTLPLSAHDTVQYIKYI